MFNRILNATLSAVSTTRITRENLEFPLPPNSLDSHQTQNSKMKLWTDPMFLLPWRHLLQYFYHKYKVPTTGVIQENPKLPLHNSLYSHQTKNNKINPGLTPRLHFLEVGELSHCVYETKNLWLIVGQLPIKAGWWNAPLALWNFSWSNKQNYFFFQL